MRVENVASVVDLLALPLPDFVEASYVMLLGRAPDLPELKERSGALRRGLGRARFLCDISLSGEFRQYQARWLNEGDEKAFIGNVFERYLGRWADTAALTHYSAICARRGRARVVQDIVRSDEARMRSTFWYELDQFLADERADRHWALRWIGRPTRRRRQRNRMAEALAQHRHSTTSVLHEPFARSGALSGARSGVRGPSAQTEGMGRHARQILGRIRHVAGAL